MFSDVCPSLSVYIGIYGLHVALTMSNLKQLFYCCYSFDFWYFPLFKIKCRVHLLYVNLFFFSFSLANQLISFPPSFPTFLICLQMTRILISHHAFEIQPKMMLGWIFITGGTCIHNDVWKESQHAACTCSIFTTNKL